ncbi:hypothetical protein N0B44_20780 [Roseibacterium beibuensis]|uniref:hypothetical protein n=1 Tax=[Roseibacterium] beibuensis TaxID=1193142 RepID=UPI00217D18E7|nr:hypothetical protein [Roseibacterium beibuensis]MCS6625352.1 hypothetical protein [Roseibacterium beibuensis]
MSIRNRALVGGVIIAAAVAGVATSQQQPPSPVAATQVALTPSRADNAALAQARQDPVAARLRGALAQGKSPDFMQRVNASDVPVLAPADPALLASARFDGGDRFYMLTVQRGEQIIEIYGATKAFQSPLGAPAPQAPPTTAAAAPKAATRAAPATAARGPRIAAAQVPDAAARALAQARARGLTNIRTERTEYGVDLSFNRFGAAYSVSLICEGAPNCTEADAIVFATGLQMIGGGA